MAMLRLRYSVKVYDKDGKLVREVDGESHSLLANFIHWLRAFARVGYGCGSYNNITDEPLVNRTGTTCHIWYNGSKYARAFGGFYGFDDCDDIGIVVGTGTTAPTPEDYALESQIPHGTGTGQLDYEEHVIGDVEISGNIVSFDVMRMFINRTENPITISEIGIMNTIWDSSNKQRFFLIARDVLSPAVEVPGYGSVNVTYTFYVTT